jgi:glycosyltransferase involved in cell wall biosynthesis
VARIVVVSNAFTYLVRFRKELLGTIQSLGHTVTVLCPMDQYAKAQSHLPVERLDLPLTQHGLNPLSELRAIMVLYRALRRLRPDVVINFTIKPAMYGSVAARLAGVPRCVSMFTGLGYWFTYPRRSSRMLSVLIRGALRLALRSNEMVFFQNVDDEKLFLSLGIARPGKTRVVDGSGVDTAAFAPRETDAVPQTFLLVARLLPEKGVREFVDAARRLRKLHPAARFWLLGPIDTSPSAISAAELQHWVGLGDVEYLGEVPDVRDIVARANVVVLPSYREGTPRSVLEAMAMGKPIVTTHAPGCRETVREGVNGFLVPVGNSEALAAAMKRFIDTPDLALKLGMESRRLAVERYDVKKVNLAFLKHIGLDVGAPVSGA